MFIAGYCIGLFGTLIALAKKYLELHREFLDLKSECEFLEAEFHDLQITALSNHQEIKIIRDNHRVDMATLAKMIESQKSSKKKAPGN